MRRRKSDSNVCFNCSISNATILTIFFQYFILPTAYKIKLDSTLTFLSHINDVVKVCRLHTPVLHHLRRFVSHDVANSMPCSIVGSAINYCNSLLHVASFSNGVLEKLQCDQSRMAHVVCSYGVRDQHTIVVPRELHWLPVRKRVTHKFVFTCKNAHRFALPPYWKRCCQVRCARLTTVPALKSNTADSRFSCAASEVWNALPRTISDAETVRAIKTYIKTHFSHSTFWLTGVHTRSSESWPFLAVVYYCRWSTPSSPCVQARINLL